MHNDTVPTVGGDTIWASGYSAYEKLSPDFRKMIDGKYAVYRSAHPYLDAGDPTAGPKYIEKNIDIQVRFKWTPRTSALWDNR